MNLMVAKNAKKERALYFNSLLNNETNSILMKLAFQFRSPSAATHHLTLVFH